jgi:prepilin-type N-terminal cleavage/methylation domain-containing protein
MTSARLRQGFTLAEMLIVLAILATVAALVVPAVGRFAADSRDAVTRQSLTRVRDAIAQAYWQDSAYQLPNSPLRANRPQLRYLFLNPATEDTTVTFDPAYRRGWRGPYLVNQPGPVYAIDNTAGFTNQYGENGDPVVMDGWGRPIVIQCPGLLPDGGLDVRLVSAGPDGVLTVPPGTPTPLLTATMTGDDVWISFEVRQP